MAALTLAIVFALLAAAPSESNAPQGKHLRPPIVGISHIALYVHDIEKSRAFYKDFLGFAEPYSLQKSNGTLHLTWIKVNDEQSIELFPEKEAGSDRLYHIAVETPDAEAMREYLAARGVSVPEKTPVGKIGNKNYFITDPDGHSVEVVEYQPGGWTALNKGKFLPNTRIATKMPHVGVLVGDLDAAQKFYGDILGFKEIWRGAKKPDQLNWVHEQVPDGQNFIELMLYSELPPPAIRGRFHHLCLEVPDIENTKATLADRAAMIGYTKPLEIQIGINRKRQLNVWDPDGTRVEFMEPGTIDGKVTPPSTAPAPQPKK